MSGYTLQKRVAWTPEEDQQLQDLVTKYGTQSWPDVAAELPGRTSKSCSLRWRCFLNPNLKRPCDDPLTEWEVAVIVEAQKAYGNRWTLIASLLPGRCNNDVKNYFNLYLKNQVPAGELKNPYLAKKQCLQSLLRDAPEDILAKERAAAAAAQATRMPLAHLRAHSTPQAAITQRALQPKLEPSAAAYSSSRLSKPLALHGLLPLDTPSHSLSPSTTAALPLLVTQSALLPPTPPMSSSMAVGALSPVSPSQCGLVTTPGPGVRSACLPGRGGMTSSPSSGMSLAEASASLPLPLPAAWGAGGSSMPVAAGYSLSNTALGGCPPLPPLKQDTWQQEQQRQQWQQQQAQQQQQQQQPGKRAKNGPSSSTTTLTLKRTFTVSTAEDTCAYSLDRPAAAKLQPSTLNPGSELCMRIHSMPPLATAPPPHELFALLDDELEALASPTHMPSTSLKRHRSAPMAELLSGFAADCSGLGPIDELLWEEMQQQQAQQAQQAQQQQAYQQQGGFGSSSSGRVSGSGGAGPAPGSYGSCNSQQQQQGQTLPQGHCMQQGQHMQQGHQMQQHGRQTQQSPVPMAPQQYSSHMQRSTPSPAASGAAGVHLPHVASNSPYSQHAYSQHSSMQQQQQQHHLQQQQFHLAPHAPGVQQQPHEGVHGSRLASESSTGCASICHSGAAAGSSGWSGMHTPAQQQQNGGYNQQPQYVQHQYSQPHGQSSQGYYSSGMHQQQGSYSGSGSRFEVQQPMLQQQGQQGQQGQQEHAWSQHSMSFQVTGAASSSAAYGTCAPQSSGQPHQQHQQQHLLNPNDELSSFLESICKEEACSLAAEAHSGGHAGGGDGSISGFDASPAECARQSYQQAGMQDKQHQQHQRQQQQPQAQLMPANGSSYAGFGMASWPHAAPAGNKLTAGAVNDGSPSLVSNGAGSHRSSPDMEAASHMLLSSPTANGCGVFDARPANSWDSSDLGFPAAQVDALLANMGVDSDSPMLDVVSQFDASLLHGGYHHELMTAQMNGCH